MSAGCVLVVGGTGLIGEPVAHALHEAGYVVRILTRQPDQAQHFLPPPFEVVGGDVTKPETLAPAMEGCTGVHISISATADPDVERRGAEAVARAAKEAGVQRLTYVSGATARPENAWFPGTKAKLDAEEAIRESGVPTTVFCPTWFMESLPRFVRGNRAWVFGTFRIPWHWVAATDFGRMVVAAYGTPEAVGKRVFIHGPEAYTLEQALRRYCGTLAPHADVKVISLRMLRFIAFIARRPQIKAIIPFMRYMEQVPEGGDPTEANELLGAPTTTLGDWTHTRLAQSTPVSE